MITILPPLPCRFIRETPCFTSEKTLSRLMALVEYHCSSLMWSIGASRGGHMPWLMTRASKAPNGRTVDSTNDLPENAESRVARQAGASSTPHYANRASAAPAAYQ